MNLDLDAVAVQRVFADVVGVSEALVSQMVRDGRLTPGGTLREWVHIYLGRLRMQVAARQGKPFEVDAAFEDALCQAALRRRAAAGGGTNGQ